MRKDESAFAMRQEGTKRSRGSEHAGWDRWVRSGAHLVPRRGETRQYTQGRKKEPRLILEKNSQCAAGTWSVQVAECTERPSHEPEKEIHTGPGKRGLSYQRGTFRVKELEGGKRNAGTRSAAGAAHLGFVQPLSESVHHRRAGPGHAPGGPRPLQRCARVRLRSGADTQAGPGPALASRSRALCRAPSSWLQVRGAGARPEGCSASCARPTQTRERAGGRAERRGHRARGASRRASTRRLR